MLIERFKYISSQPAESAKFMYENNVMKGYDGKDIVSALKHGTLAIGQLGLAETLQILVGCDQTEKRGMKVAKRIEQLFKDRCAEFKKEYKLNFGVYYTPAENLCFTAMTRFKEKYGEIPNVSDKNSSQIQFTFQYGKKLTHLRRLTLNLSLRVIQVPVALHMLKSMLVLRTTLRLWNRLLIMQWIRMSLISL